MALAPETARAVALAERILDRPNGDPDDDLAVLARAFMRQMEHNPDIAVRRFLADRQRLIEQMA